MLGRLGLNGGDSRRVQWEPSQRLLRYYTTLGLLDRASKMVARTAYYSRRHLMQLLAIKSLQHEGMTLQEIQQELLGNSDSQLLQRLGLPSDWEVNLAACELPEESPVPRRRFWESAPEIPEVEAVMPLQTETGCRELVEIALAPGLTIAVDRRLFPDFEMSQLAPHLESIAATIQESLSRKTN